MQGARVSLLSLLSPGRVVTDQKKKNNCERLTAHRLCCIITPQWVIERRRLQHTKSLTPGLTRVCAFTCVYVYVYEGCDGKTLRSNAK